jgi:hypothetical protein
VRKTFATPSVAELILSATACSALSAYCVTILLRFLCTEG